MILSPFRYLYLLFYAPNRLTYLNWSVPRLFRKRRFSDHSSSVQSVDYHSAHIHFADDWNFLTLAFIWTTQFPVSTSALTSKASMRIITFHVMITNRVANVQTAVAFIEVNITISTNPSNGTNTSCWRKNCFFVITRIIFI